MHFRISGVLGDQDAIKTLEKEIIDQLNEEAEEKYKKLLVEYAKSSSSSSVLPSPPEKITTLSQETLLSKIMERFGAKGTDNKLFHHKAASINDEADNFRFKAKNISQGRLSGKRRYIYTFLSIDGINYIYVLKDDPDHRPDKTKYANPDFNLQNYFEKPKVKANLKAQLLKIANSKVDTSKQIEKTADKSDFKALPIETHLFNGELYKLTEDQQKALLTETPCGYVGSAGSGKTLVSDIALDYENNKGNYVVYIEQNDKLRFERETDHRKSYPNCNADFSNYGNLLWSLELKKPENERRRFITKDEYALKIKELIEIINKKGFNLTEQDFIKETRVLFGYDRNEYLALGPKESHFGGNDDKYKINLREALWEAGSNLLDYLDREHLIHPDITQLPKDSLPAIIVDEAQNLTLAQLKSLFYAAKGRNIRFIFDNNQMLLDQMRHKIEFLKKLANKHGITINICHLKENLRSSIPVTNLGNNVLDVVNQLYREGRNSNIEGNPEKKGNIIWLPIKQLHEANLCTLTTNSIDTAVIVLPKFIDEAVKKFGKDKIYTVDEIQGLQYKNIILYRMFDGEDHKEEFEFAAKILKLGIPAEKNKDVKAHLIWNHLYTAVTRAEGSVIVYQDFKAKKNKNLEPLYDKLRYDRIKNEVTPYVEENVNVLTLIDYTLKNAENCKVLAQKLIIEAKVKLMAEEPDLVSAASLEEKAKLLYCEYLNFEGKKFDDVEFQSSYTQFKTESLVDIIDKLKPLNVTLKTNDNETNPSSTNSTETKPDSTNSSFTPIDSNKTETGTEAKAEPNNKPNQEKIVKKATGTGKEKSSEAKQVIIQPPGPIMQFMTNILDGRKKLTTNDLTKKLKELGIDKFLDYFFSFYFNRDNKAASFIGHLIEKSSYQHVLETFVKSKEWKAINFTAEILSRLLVFALKEFTKLITLEILLDEENTRYKGLINFNKGLMAACEDKTASGENKLKALIRNGADVNFIEDNIDTPLLLAIGTKQFDKVKLLLANKANPNLSCFGESPMMLALARVDYDITKTLLEHGADAQSKDCNGNPFLSRAIVIEDIRFVKLFLEDYRVKLNDSEQGFITPILNAIKSRKYNLLKYLLDNYAINFSQKDLWNHHFWHYLQKLHQEIKKDPNNPIYEEIKLIFSHPVIKCCEDKFILPATNEVPTTQNINVTQNNVHNNELAKMLFEDFSVEALSNLLKGVGTNNFLQILFHKLSQDQGTVIVQIFNNRYLLQQFLQFLASSEWITIFSSAQALEKLNQEQIALLKQIAEVDILMSGTGLSKLFIKNLIGKYNFLNDEEIAVILSRDLRAESDDIFNEVISRLSDLSKPDEFGLTLLHRAVQKGSLKKVELLLEKNVSPNIIVNDLSPLWLAVRIGHLAITQTLLNKGADVKDYKGPDNWSVLHLAAADGHLEILKQLLTKYPEKLNETTEFGDTVLALAARNKHYNICGYILNNCQNIDLNAANKLGNTVYNMLESGFTEFVRKNNFSKIQEKLDAVKKANNIQDSKTLVTVPKIIPSPLQMSDAVPAPKENVEHKQEPQQKALPVDKLTTLLNNFSSVNLEKLFKISDSTIIISSLLEPLIQFNNKEARLFDHIHDNETYSKIYLNLVAKYASIVTQDYTLLHGTILLAIKHNDIHLITSFIYIRDANRDTPLTKAIKDEKTNLVKLFLTACTSFDDEIFKLNPQNIEIQQMLKAVGSNEQIAGIFIDALKNNQLNVIDFIISKYPNHVLEIPKEKIQEILNNLADNKEGCKKLLTNITSNLLDQKTNYAKKIETCNLVIHLISDNDALLRIGYYQRALSYFTMNEFDKSISDYAFALELAVDPEDKATILADRAGTYIAKGEREIAIHDLNEAMNLTKDSKLKASLSNNLGIIYYGKYANYELAISYFTKALSYNIDDPKLKMAYLNYRSRSYLKNKQYDETIADCTEALKLSSNEKLNITFYLQLANAWQLKGNINFCNINLVKALQQGLSQEQKIQLLPLLKYEDKLGTVVHHAASDPLLAQLLLNVEGVDVNQTNKKGETPLDIALKRQNPTIVKLFLLKNATYDQALIKKIANDQIKKMFEVIKNNNKITQIYEEACKNNYIELVDFILTKYPTHVAVNHKILNVYKNIKHNGYTDILRVIIKNTEKLRDQALSHIAKEEFNDGLLKLNKAISIYPLNILPNSQNFFSILHFNCGINYSGLGKRQEAIDTYTKAIEFATDLEHKAACYISRALIYHSMGEYVKAIEDFDTTLMSCGIRTPEILLYRGITKRANKEFQDAINDFLRIVELNFQNQIALKAYINLAEIYHFDLKNIPESIRYYSNAIFLCGNNIKLKTDLISKLGNAYSNIFDYENATIEFTRWIKLLDDNDSNVKAVALEVRGNTYLLQNKCDESIADYLNAIKLIADDHKKINIYIKISDCYHLKQDEPNKAKYIEIALALGPNEAQKSQLLELKTLISTPDTELSNSLNNQDKPIKETNLTGLNELNPINTFTMFATSGPTLTSAQGTLLHNTTNQDQEQKHEQNAQNRLG